MKVFYKILFPRTLTALAICLVIGGLSQQQVVQDVSYNEAIQSICAKGTDKVTMNLPLQLSQIDGKQFPFNFIGVLTVYAPKQQTLTLQPPQYFKRLCSAILLSTRAILTSADCLYTRNIGVNVQSADNPMTFTTHGAQDEQKSEFKVQSYFVPEEFKNSNPGDTEQFNFGVAFLEEEINDELLMQRKYRFPLSDDECKDGEVSNIIGFEHNEDDGTIEWAGLCIYNQNGCNNTCDVDQLDDQDFDYNGSPIIQCELDQQFTVRGIHNKKIRGWTENTALTPDRVDTIIGYLKNASGSTPLVGMSMLTNYTFSRINAAFDLSPITQETQDCSIGNSGNGESSYAVPIVVTFVVTAVGILLIQFLIWKLFSISVRTRKTDSYVEDIEAELEDDVDLQIDIDRDISKKQIIGKGGFGYVYKGQWKPRARYVAYKTIKDMDMSTLQSQASEIERMKQELVVLCQIRHQNVLHCYGGCLEPKVALVMEFCKGGDLYNYIFTERRGKLETAECLSVGYDVACGLEYLHSKKNHIIHRDIKSKNILRTRSRKDVVGPVKIADFGLAKLLPDSESWGGTSSNMGTIVYMAPELHQKESNVIHFSRKADIYALGIVLYECATGQYAWGKETKREIILSQLVQGRRPQMPEDIDQDLQRIIQKCWAHSPQDRPESSQLVSEFGELLQEKANMNRSKSGMSVLVEMAKVGSSKTLSSIPELDREDTDLENIYLNIYPDSQVDAPNGSIDSYCDLNDTSKIN